MARIPIYLHAADPISLAGLAGQLRPRAEVAVIEANRLTGAEVAVVVADVLDGETLRSLRSLRSRGLTRLVVVAARIDDADLVAVAGVGVAGLVHRAEATADRLVMVIQSAAAGEGFVPPDLLGRLLAQVGRLPTQASRPRGLTPAGLAEREIDVLRLVADGLDTAEIAAKLAYSERTVKNVLHAATSRLHLRNRSHAVAYALRHGLI